MSRANQCLVYAHSRGYRVLENGSLVSPKGRVLNPGTNADGYRWFRVRSTDCPIRVHRLQAFQKYGSAIFGTGIQVRHLDGNRQNNGAANIAIGTATENSMDKPAVVRMAAALKATAVARRHDHAAILAFLNAGHTQGQARAAFGIRSKGTMSFIARKSLLAS